MARSVDQWVRETSLLAYHELKDHGSLSEMQSRVAYLIACYPDKTDRELSQLYFNVWGDLDPNAVRPRRHELMEQGWVEESGKRPCQVTGKMALTWRIKTARDQQQMELF